MAGDHPLVARSAVRVADLAGVGYVERTACEFEAHYVDGYGAWPVEIDVRCRSAREDCVQALIATGLGVAIVPASLPLRPDLVTRPLVEPEVVRRVCLVTPRDRTPTAPVTVMRRLVAASGEVWATAID
jgi:DNA-binding transcriptional LysR family regulator